MDEMVSHPASKQPSSNSEMTHKPTSSAYKMKQQYMNTRREGGRKEGPQSLINNNRPVIYSWSPEMNLCCGGEGESTDCLLILVNFAPGQERKETDSCLAEG